MAGEPALKLKILTELDKSGMEKEIAQLKKSFDTGIVNQLQTEIKVLKKAIGQGTDEKQLKPLIEMKKQAQQQLFDVTGGEYGRGTKPTDEPPKETGEFFKGILKGMGPILSLLTKISLGAAVGVALYDVLKPALNIANTILKLLAEFTRPIMYMTLSLLMPILNLLKPLLMVFNAIFAPFKGAIMKLNASAALDIAKGMKTDDPGLLALGMSKSIVASGLGLVGFSKAMMDVGLQLLKIATTASAQLLNLVIRAMSYGFGMLINAVGAKETAKKFMGIMGSISGGMEGTVENINQFLDNAMGAMFDKVIEGAIWFSDKLGVDISGELSGAISGISLGDAIKSFISTEGVIFADVASTISGILSGKFDDTFKNLDLGTSFDTFKDLIVTKTEAAIADAQLQLEENAKNKKEKLAKETTDSAGGAIEVPFYTMADTVGKTNKQLFEDIDAAARETATVVSTNMGTTGLVPTKYDNSMSAMSESTSKFGASVKTVADLLGDAISKMQGYASAYQSAVRTIDRLSSINRTRNTGNALPGS